MKLLPLTANQMAVISLIDKGQLEAMLNGEDLIRSIKKCPKCDEKLYLMVASVRTLFGISCDALCPNCFYMDSVSTYKDN